MYGIDWDGPIPLGEFQNGTVVVDEIQSVLSHEQRLHLDEEMLEVNPTQSLAQEILVNQFVKAKLMIHSLHDTSDL